MPIQENHSPVKPEKIAATAAVALEQSLVLPATFVREGIDAFAGSDNDTINVRVEGVVPWREYGWRNDRTDEIEFDEYAERKIAVDFGGDIYSALRLTDEQQTMDFDGWAKLASKQVEAIGKGLEYEATQAVIEAPYEVVLTLDESNLRASLNRAKKVLDKLHVPANGRLFYLSDDVELALLNDEKLNLASNVGDGEALSALREATLGRRSGFTFISAGELPDGEAVATGRSAFIFTTGAPAVPQSAPFGATAAYNDVAIRWIRDYETTRLRERSVFNTYKGFRHVDDLLIGVNGSGQRFVSQHEHFIRAVKFVLGEGREHDDIVGGAKGAELESIVKLGSLFGDGSDAGDVGGDDSVPGDDDA